MAVSVQPDVLCLQMQPGEARISAVSIAARQVPRRVTAALSGGGGLVRATRLVALRTVRRHLSEDEIRELPPLPPSIRENARRNGVEERIEIQHPAGVPVELDAGEALDVELEFSVPTQTPEGIVTGTLRVADEGGAAEVPLVCVVGRVTAVPVVEPARLRAALVPGESRTLAASIVRAPSGDSLVAFVVAGRGVIRLSSLIALRETHRPATEDEIAELPRFPPSIREDARRHGFVEMVETARSDGRTPLPVAAGQTVLASVVFDATAAGSQDIVDAELVIDSPRWQRVAVPLRRIVGDFSIEPVNDALEITQGESFELVATVHSHAGQGGLVGFEIEGGEGPVSLFHDPVVMKPRGSTVARLVLTALPDAALGVRHATLLARAYEEMQVRRHPLRIHVVPGGLSVSAVPAAVSVRQGDSIGLDIVAVSNGGAKHVTLEPGALPPGVRLERAAFTLAPGHDGHRQPLRLTVDADAPPARRAWMPIHWSDRSALLSGLLNVPLTIELRPDSRHFHHVVTTPAGTALGGFADLELRNDGTIVFSGHMHGSGFDPYAFRISYFVRAANLTLALSDVFSGRVGGTLGGGPRDRDWRVEFMSPLLRQHWRALRDSRPEFGLWYEDTGLLGSLDDIALALGKFLVLHVLAGPATAAALVLGPELARLVDLPVTSPRAIPGSVILGGVVFLFGPLAAVPALVAGIAVAAADDVKSRRMHDDEIAFARRIFGDTLPIDRIRVTNLLKRGDEGERAFTTLNTVDRTILLGMGPDFDTHMTANATFVHELTHAWQHEHRPFALEDVAGDIERPFLGTEEEMRLYLPPEDGRPWRNVHSEAQARTVELWFIACSPDLESETARSHRHFHYIANNLRTGQP